MAVDRIGHVDVKSGMLLVFDFGLIGAFEERTQAREAAIAALEAGSTEFEHNGVGGVVVRGIAPGRHSVFSESLEGFDIEGLRRSVIIDFAPGKTAARTVELGSVPVDMARIGIFDVAAVEHWNESEPSDGKADVAFWGLHGEEVAKRFEAKPLGDETFGFADLPIDKAVQVAEKLNVLRNTGELRFAFDLRPHTDPFFLLAQLRENESEAGVITVGGYDVCGLMTTWGDGFFPVTLDLDESGAPLRTTILFATDEAKEAMRDVNGID